MGTLSQVLLAHGHLVYFHVGTLVVEILVVSPYRLRQLLRSLIPVTASYNNC
jgi:hypothetical protein